MCMSQNYIICKSKKVDYCLVSPLPVHIANYTKNINVTILNIIPSYLDLCLY